MSAISAWTLTAEELEAAHNQVKDVLLQYLHNHGYLTEEQTEELMLTHQILVKKPGIISQLYRRILGKKANTPHIMVAQIERLEPEEEKKDE